MLKIIYNILPQKNISSNFYVKNNIFDINDQLPLSKSIFNQLNKFLISKEIEFDNVSTDEKKDDKNIISTNFVINNLLNIIVYKNQLLKFSTLSKDNIKDKIQKKKSDKYIIKNELDRINVLNNIIHDNIDIKQKKIQISKKKIFPEKINYDKNKFFQINKLIENFNMSKNFHEVETQCKPVKKAKNLLKINENYEKNVKNEKNLIFYQNFKNHKNTLFFYDNTSKVKNLVNAINSSQETDTKELIKSNTQKFLSYDLKNSIKWKNLISQKILLSIANKNNQAEIYLKPENLGSIYIKINMKNNKATLDFISNHKEIRTFLDNHISSLRHSLIKNGIKLGKVNIFGALKNKNLKNYKNNFNLFEFQKKFDFNKKNINIENNSIDIYI